MLPDWEKVLFGFIIVATFLAFIWPVYLRLRIIRRGQPEPRLGEVARRIKETLAQVFLQKCTLKNERLFTGLMHVFIFYSALTFDTITINHTLEGFVDGFYLFGDTGFGLFFSLLVDVFAVLVLVGVFFFIIRRFIIRPKAYRTTLVDSAIIYLMLIVVTLSYLYFEAFAIVSHPESSRLAFLGSALAQKIRVLGLPAGVLSAHLRLSWWLHILLVFGFIAYVPHSKYFHMFTGPINVFLRSSRPSGEIRPIDIEKSEIFGVEKVTDMTWKDLLDAFACMECGRCQDACPAYASGKPLSPKMIIFNLKKHLLADRGRTNAKKREELESFLASTARARSGPARLAGPASTSALSRSSTSARSSASGRAKS
jgi:nitrate reductase gamma subunit/ferredoxin